MPRVPLHSGSRLPVVALPDDVALLAAPPPLDPIADVEAAVVEALRYPLDGQPLDRLVTRGGRATIVVQPASLPLPAVEEDPRRDALGAVIGEVERLGFARERITLLVAGGLGRRAGRRELELLLQPERARDFRGVVSIHDCEAADLQALTLGARTARVHPALLETDLVVAVGAAETVLHGGPGALVDACGGGTIRAAAAVESQLEPAGTDAWRLATSLETELRRGAPVVGVSLVLDRPRTVGLYRGYPWDADARRAVARSPFRRLLNVSPSMLRRRVLDELRQELSVLTALAGSPSVAHAEALVRGTAVRSVTVDEPFDTLVVPLPWTASPPPHEPLNPITAAATGLGYALRLWRDEPPLKEGGTVVLLHPLSWAPGHASQAPYRAALAALREGGERVGAFEAAAARDRRALSAYANGTAPHPRLPFAEWDGCRPVLERAGRVIVAGCRDANAARALGLVPSHNVSTALAMAAGLAPDNGRTGVVLGPPYPALVVGPAAG